MRFFFSKTLLLSFTNKINTWIPTIPTTPKFKVTKVVVEQFQSFFPFFFLLRRCRTWLLLCGGGRTIPYIGSLLDDYSPVSKVPIYRLFRSNFLSVKVLRGIHHMVNNTNRGSNNSYWKLLQGKYYQDFLLHWVLYVNTICCGKYGNKDSWTYCRVRIE